MCKPWQIGGLRYRSTHPTLLFPSLLLLCLMGLDHTRLTDFHGGRDQRLTDVKGIVIEKALA
jgi:hypothetical protein